MLCETVACSPAANCFVSPENIVCCLCRFVLSRVLLMRAVVQRVKKASVKVRKNKPLMCVHQ